MDEKFHKEAQQVVDHNIHNYIDNAALWFVDIIKKKVADNDEAGLTFTCMAAGTMLAFSFEAYLNAIGTKKLPLWNDWDDYHAKIDKIFQHLKISPDWGKRPYSSVSAMKGLRNTLAHGKPEKTEKSKTFIDKADGQKGKEIDMTADWQKLCTPAMITNAYDDLTEVSKGTVPAGTPKTSMRGPFLGNLYFCAFGHISHGFSHPNREWRHDPFRSA
jgi:hypothetical protein